MKKLIIICLLILSTSVSINAQNVPAKIQVQFILKIVSMDKNMGRLGNPIKIGVSSDALVGAFNSVSGITIAGTPFTVTKLSSPGDVNSYKVVVIDTNWKGNYSAVGKMAAAGKILMFAGDESGVKKNKGGLGFKIVGGKPKILANIDNLKKQGSDFPVNFFKMAVLVK